MQDKKIFFIHVPKTAGSSFNSVLQAHFRGDVHCEKYFEPDCRKLRFIDKLQAMEFLSGHLTLADFNANQFSRNDYLLVTFVRRPLQQLVSHLNWLVRIRDLGERFFAFHPPHIQALSTQMRAMDLTQADNLITVLSQQRALFQNNQSSYFLDEASDFDLNIILQNVDSLDFVGLTEQFDQSLQKLAPQLGRTLVAPEHSENVNPDYRLTEDNILHDLTLNEFVREYNKIDNALYQHCQNRFAALAG